jgi:hypothetical protein
MSGDSQALGQGTSRRRLWGPDWVLITLWWKPLDMMPSPVGSSSLPVPRLCQVSQCTGEMGA